MEQSLLLLWSCLLGTVLTLVQPPVQPVPTLKPQPRPPRLIGCVFRIHSSIACHWEPGDIPATQYTLEVQKRPLFFQLNFENCTAMGLCFTCNTTSTTCTIEIPQLKVRINYCITITAHSENSDISSEPRCQSGRKEVVLPAVTLENVKEVPGLPQCLRLSWRRILPDFCVSDREIERELNSQIEFQTLVQPGVHMRNMTVTDLSVRCCFFEPDTSYSIRLRNRYQGLASPWSPWSNSLQGRTAEDAPSAAPMFWRQIKQTDGDEWRIVSLLWKPLPRFLANGRVRFYNVTCQTENIQPLGDYGSCKDLLFPSVSCSLRLPSSRCSCTLTASTTAGTSPEATIWFPDGAETELAAPNEIIAKTLSDSSLEVWWTYPRNPFISGFIVEWFAVSEKTNSILYWEQLNSSRTKLLVTEGVKPMERYAVSVRVLYGKQEAGKNRTLQIYTRQGTPSTGPNVTVQHIYDDKVQLSWSPLPVELLHGFLCSYTISYTTGNQITKSVLVPGHVHRHTLENLSPGNYHIFIQASTVVGLGPAGTQANVHIGYEKISIVRYFVVPLVMSFLVLAACVMQVKRMKQKMFLDVPDPSNSSLSNWTSENTSKIKKPLMIQEKPHIFYCNVILLDKLLDLENDRSKEDLYGFQNFSSRIEQTTGTEAEKNLVTDFSTLPCIYSNVLLSPTNTDCSTAISFPSEHRTFNCTVTCFNDIILQPNRSSESPDSPFSNEEKTHFSLKSLQSPISFFEPHSSCLVSHQNEANTLNSPLFLQPNTICPKHGALQIF